MNFLGNSKYELKGIILLKIKGSLTVLYDFKCTHNLTTSTESNIRHALVAEDHIYHVLELLSHGERGLQVFTCSEKGKGKNKVFFNRDKERG